ncbi:MAG TPA: L-threonylcarbamoyladenylate synthase [Candidatus Sulfomarinibacteraceae bacterium]|nr:L-threonylcarbamoyladenylate synthase [Candidatus Sulfomarinibacteraceae bacterium]
MKTEVIPAAAYGALENVAALLKAGQLVVFPTDTLYGVGVSAFEETAIKRLYEVKERPLSKGIPILLGDTDDVDKVARSFPTIARSLMERFWPGALTIIVPRRPDLPPSLSPNENIALRIPDSEVARAIIRHAGGAVATTSANRSGEAPARNAQEALSALGGLVAAIVDGGPVAHGVPSTIVDCTTTPPRILRRGPLSAADLSLDRA